MALIATLRQPLSKRGSSIAGRSGRGGSLAAGESQGEDESAYRSVAENPPSFYEDDLKKWKNKFSEVIESRA